MYLEAAIVNSYINSGLLKEISNYGRLFKQK